MKEFEILESYIDALGILTNQYSKPFDIEVLEAKNDSTVVCRFIHDNNQKNKIFEGLLKVFPNLKKENINYQDNYLLYPPSDPIENYKIDILYLKMKKSTIKQDFDKYQFLTLDDLEVIDSELESNHEVFRKDTLGAISKVIPSESFMNNQLESAIKYLKEKIGLFPFKVSGFFKQIQLKGVVLKREVFEDFQENTFYSMPFHRISYTITPEEFEKFEQTRKRKKIFYNSELPKEDFNFEGIVLPSPDNNVFIQSFPASMPLSELQFKTFFFLNALKQYFGKEHIQIVREYTFKIDKKRFFKHFLEHIREVIYHKEFQISSDIGTISFDFNNKEELVEKLQKLNSYDSFDYIGFKDDHRYKVTFENITPLFKIKEQLDKLSFTKSILNESENELKVISSLPNIRAIIEKAAGNFGKDNIALSWDAFDNSLIKYYFHFNEGNYKQEVQRKLANFLGETLSLAESKETLGVLKSISYPNLTLLIEDKSLLEEGAYLTVRSTLKSKKDKVKKLRDVVEKIYSDSGNSICNKDLIQALMDSSSLKSFIDGDITLTKKYKELYQKVNSDLLNPYINDQQKGNDKGSDS